MNKESIFLENAGNAILSLLMNSSPFLSPEVVTTDQEIDFDILENLCFLPLLIHNPEKNLLSKRLDNFMDDYGRSMTYGLSGGLERRIVNELIHKIQFIDCREIMTFFESAVNRKIIICDASRDKLPAFVGNQIPDYANSWHIFSAGENNKTHPHDIYVSAFLPENEGILFIPGALKVYLKPIPVKSYPESCIIDSVSKMSISLQYSLPEKEICTINLMAAIGIEIIPEKIARFRLD